MLTTSKSLSIDSIDPVNFCKSVSPLTRNRAYAAVVEKPLTPLKAFNLSSICRARDSRLPSSPSLTRTTKRPSSGAPNSATPAESGPRHPSACSMPRIVRPTSTWPSLVFAKNPTMPHIGSEDTRSILPVCWGGKQAAAAQSMVTAVYKASSQAEGEVERVYRLLHEWLVSAQLPPGEFLSDAVGLTERKTTRRPARGS